MRGINRQNIFDDEEDYNHFIYNKKNERVGHLFQERFKSEPCNDEEYFTTLFRYISQNPVKAGIVKNEADYRWGSWNHDYTTILPKVTAVP